MSLKMLEVGFGKVDITPRVGVEMSGFGPYIHRRGLAVRDRLFARAMAVKQGGNTIVIISCDLVGVERDVTHRVRAIVREATGLPDAAVMVHCTHTHSGPAVCPSMRGWGEVDEPYLVLLPALIAKAAIDAATDISPAEVRHVKTPCEGLGINREDEAAPEPADSALLDNWRPKMPERTDTTCHVLTIHKGDRMAGFVSSFGCHPVVCCALTTYLHGDFCGVATNLLEREHPGSVGLFLQGALGDVNVCFVHQPESASMHALDILASRFACAVRQGMHDARPIEIDSIAYASKTFTFSRCPLTVADLQKMLAENERILANPKASDAGEKERMATIYVLRLRELITRMNRDESLSPCVELQAIRLGPIGIYASPYEPMQNVKNDILAKVNAPVPVVLSVTNDAQGYATDKSLSGRAEYAARTIPYVLGQLPLLDIHNELVAATMEMDAAIFD